MRVIPNFVCPVLGGYMVSCSSCPPPAGFGSLCIALCAARETQQAMFDGHWILICLHPIACHRAGRNCPSRVLNHRPASDNATLTLMSPCPGPDERGNWGCEPTEGRQELLDVPSEVARSWTKIARGARFSEALKRRLPDNL